MQHNTVSFKSSRRARVSAAKQVSDAKLEAAHKRVRELELKTAQLELALVDQQSRSVVTDDPVRAEVEGRLGLVKPLLTSLVQGDHSATHTSCSGVLSRGP